MYKDGPRREVINELHHYHQCMYRGERKSYYSRRDLAVNNPKLFYSDISDGMAQNKTSVPHGRDTFEFKPNMKQHIQGVLSHGRALDMYRSFHNVKGTLWLTFHLWSS